MKTSSQTISQNIEKALMADISLSSYAHGVTVTEVDGVVTMRGRAKSDREKQVVLAKARDVAGQSNVVDEIAVSPPVPE